MRMWIRILQPVCCLTVSVLSQNINLKNNMHTYVHLEQGCEITAKTIPGSYVEQGSAINALTPCLSTVPQHDVHRYNP